MCCQQCPVVSCCAAGIVPYELKMWRPGKAVGGCPQDLWRLEGGEGSVPCLWSSVGGAEQVGGCQWWREEQEAVVHLHAPCSEMCGEYGIQYMYMMCICKPNKYNIGKLHI